MINDIALLLPVFLFIAFIEWYISNKQGKKLYSHRNTAINLAIGAIDQLFSIIGYLMFYFVLSYVYENYRWYEFENTWVQWILAYLAIDFISYWYHRFSHEINFLWAGHFTHHSSDHFNFSNGFRTSPFQGLNRIPFWIVLPLIGFSPFVLILTFKISGIYDFFQHTQNFPRMKYLEKILITPTLHSVHHGKNNIYIDKNYGSTFVIWDKLFGTFQERTEPVEFGITNEDYVDDSPIRAIFFHYNHLWKLIKATSGWQNKIKILWMPPNWGLGDISLQNSRKAIQKIDISVVHKQYAILQLIFCAAGVTLVLLFQDFLIPVELIILSISSIYGMVNGAMILNQSIKPNFKNQEILRLSISLFLLIIYYMISLKFYLLYISAYFTFSLILVSRLPKVEVERKWVNLLPSLENNSIKTNRNFIKTTPCGGAIMYLPSKNKNNILRERLYSFSQSTQSSFTPLIGVPIYNKNIVTSEILSKLRVNKSNENIV